MSEEKSEPEGQATFACSVVTPQRRVFAGEVSRVCARGVGGAFEVLPGHEPVMTPLAVDLMEIESPAGHHVFVIHGGFLDMDGETLTVLADAAERSEEVDQARASAARERARERLEAVSGAAEDIAIDEDRARMALLRANLRIRVSEQAREA